MPPTQRRAGERSPALCGVWLERLVFSGGAPRRHREVPGHAVEPAALRLPDEAPPGALALPGASPPPGDVPAAGPAPWPVAMRQRGCSGSCRCRACWDGQHCFLQAGSGHCHRSRHAPGQPCSSHRDEPWRRPEDVHHWPRRSWLGWCWPAGSEPAARWWAAHGSHARTELPAPKDEPGCHRCRR